MRATLYCQADLSAPWGFSYAYQQGAIFYFLQEGACTVQIEGEEAQRYYAGDFILIPNSHAHRVLDQAGSGCASLDELMAQRYDPSTRSLRYGGGGAHTRIVAGCLWLEDSSNSFLVRSLPTKLVVSRQQGALTQRVEQVVGLLEKELEEASPAQDAVLVRYAELLFIEAVRQHLESLPPDASSWLKGVKDPVIGPTLARIETDLAQEWLVEELAGKAGVSRSAYAQRFKQAIGVSPRQYLIQRRMECARRMLRHTEATMLHIAGAIGYESEMAFSKAFRKTVGCSPGQYRKQGRGRLGANGAP